MRSGSLRSQLLIRSLLLLLTILIGVGVIQYVWMEQFLYRNKAESIRQQISVMPGEMWQRLAEGVRRGREFPVLLLDSTSIVLRDRDGELTELSTRAGPQDRQADQPQWLGDASQANDRPALYQLAKNRDGKEQLVITQPVRSFNGGRAEIQVSYATGPIRQDLYRQMAIYFVVALFALLIGAIIFLPVIRRALIPLTKVTNTVEQIDAGHLSERLPDMQGQTEIDRLAHSFNHMLERLELSFQAEQEAKEQMRRFIADASHELRTPLTTIHGFVEVLLRGAAKQPQQLEQALLSMFSESKRLSKLVQDLLLLANLDRTPELRTVPTDLNAVLTEMNAQLLVLARERGVRLELQPIPQLPLDVDKMKQVILNLFHNAVQHTDPTTGRIVISTMAAQNSVLLTIADNGRGIDPRHLSRLFDRFYRVDESRSRMHGGTGLGLAITKSIIEHHGGTIEASSAVGHGSQFLVRLPAAATVIP